MYRESYFLQLREGREKALWSTTVTTLTLWIPFKHHCTIGTITQKCQDIAMCMDTSHIFKKQVDTKIQCASTKKIGIIITDFFPVFSIHGMLSLYLKLFTSGFAGTLAIQPWFTIHDIQSHRWKHGHNLGGTDNHIAVREESFVPMIGEIGIVSWLFRSLGFCGRII